MIILIWMLNMGLKVMMMIDLLQGRWHWGRLLLAAMCSVARPANFCEAFFWQYYRYINQGMLTWGKALAVHSAQGIYWS
jgi:hypothetical protein